MSIALVRRDGTPTIGVVYDPVRQTMIHAIAGQGAFRNGHSMTVSQKPDQQPSSGTVLSLFTDRSFLSSEQRDQMIFALEEIARVLGLAGLNVDASAGAVMNACKVLANAPACYVKLPKENGGGSLWDYAATACIFSEAGRLPPTSMADVSNSTESAPRSCVTEGSCSPPTRRSRSDYELCFAQISNHRPAN